MGLAASHFLWVRVRIILRQKFITVPKVSGKDWRLWRSCPRKLDFLTMSQNSSWWSSPSGRYTLLLPKISRDQSLMWHLQIQFIKLIFFSSLMIEFREEERFLSMHWRWLMLPADSRPLNHLLPKSLRKFQRLFREFTKDRWDGPRFFRLILDVNSRVK